MSPTCEGVGVSTSEVQPPKKRSLSDESRDWRPRRRVAGRGCTKQHALILPDRFEAVGLEPALCWLRQDSPCGKVLQQRSLWRHGAHHLGQRIDHLFQVMPSLACLQEAPRQTRGDERRFLFTDVAGARLVRVLRRVKIEGRCVANCSRPLNSLSRFLANAKDGLRDGLRFGSLQTLAHTSCCVRRVRLHISFSSE